MRSPYKAKIKRLDKEIKATVRRALDLSIQDCNSWREYIDRKIKAFINLELPPMTRDIVEGELNNEVSKLRYNKMKLAKYKRNEQRKETQRRATKNWEKNPANYYSGKVMEGGALKIQDQRRNRKVRLPKGRRLSNELSTKKEIPNSTKKVSKSSSTSRS